MDQATLSERLQVKLLVSGILLAAIFGYLTASTGPLIANPTWSIVVIVVGTVWIQKDASRRGLHRDRTQFYLTIILPFVMFPAYIIHVAPKRFLLYLAFGLIYSVMAIYSMAAGIQLGTQ